MSTLRVVLSWTKHEFSSGWYVGDDFKSFAKDFRKLIREIAVSTGWEVLKYQPGHYYISTFIKRGDGQIIYVSTQDVRHSMGWWSQSILYRTAKSDTDYTGWSNHHSAVEDLMDSISNLR